MKWKPFYKQRALPQSHTCVNIFVYFLDPHCCQRKVLHINSEPKHRWFVELFTQSKWENNCWILYLFVEITCEINNHTIRSRRILVFISLVIVSKHKLSLAAKPTLVFKVICASRLYLHESFDSCIFYKWADFWIGGCLKYASLRPNRAHTGSS